MGATDPFLMGPTYTPAAGVRRFLSGTPPILGMLPLRDMLDLIDEVGIGAVREKSVALTSYAVELADELLAPLGVEVASPRDPARRGGHVTLRHPAMQAPWPRAVAARRDPRLPRPRRPADRAVAAVHVLRRGRRRCRRCAEELRRLA